VPSLRVLSVVLLAGMGAAVAAVGGLGGTGEPEPQVRGGLITGGPGASATSGLDPLNTEADEPPATSAAAFDVRAENQKTGTPGWRITRARATEPGLSGYASVVSVLPGQSVPLAVSADGPVRVRALRIGWYDGVGARQIWQGTLRAEPQTGDPASWPARGRADTTGWPEGHYLLRLDQGAASRYLPLTVRSADNRNRVVVLTSPLTWQAENTPAAPVTTAPEPLPIISFNRPYAAGYGSAGFLPNDAAIVQQAERSGRQIGFVTDYDVATDPTALTAAAAVLIGGDSQYWTASLRNAIRSAEDAGTNVAFFGAGTGSRQIRLADAGRGLQISRADPSRSLALTGLRPSCSPDPQGKAPAGSGADWKVSNADWWGYRGAGLRTGDVLPGLLGDRVDRAVTSAAGSPKPLQVLASARIPCAAKSGTVVTQSAAYLVRPSGAGVFTAGTGRWACALTGRCPNRTGPAARLDRATERAVTKITRNVIDAFAEAEAGRRFPATSTASP
jgi:hypothetical protein